ncbi:hypothetical protein J6590_072413 [Homalodisca vitripennis]|nr:hypothetical protein J6590_072413 [Homalodisca vitripennis]
MSRMALEINRQHPQEVASCCSDSVTVDRTNKHQTLPSRTEQGRTNEGKGKKWSGLAATTNG